MWFWWFILICNCIIPVLMIIAGRMMWKHCPKKINGIVGYRTKMSMKNMDTWKFAHKHAGNNAIQLSIISVVFCHREPLFFMPKNFKNITKNS